MNNLLADKLRFQLHQLFPEAKDCANNTEISINCPLCCREGNIDKNNHMYISLGIDNKPPMFNCFRNINHRGLLTKSVIEEFTMNHGLIDDELFKDIDSNNKRISFSNRFYLNKNQKFNIYPNLASNSKLSNYKLDYINNRLGFKLELQELQNKKIILNLYEFLSYNKLNRLTRHKSITDIIDRYYIGFLTNNNSSLIMRNLHPNPKILPEGLQKRYLKYNLFQNNQNSSGYYMIPTICNIGNKIKIHIAEGTFDILSIFYNICENNIYNNIYVSIGGNSYLNCIQYFLTSIGIIDSEFHVYIDNDISSDTINKLRNVLHPINIPVYIHMNIYKEQKDFGVSKDKINLYTYKL